MKKCIYCNDLVESSIWKEEGVCVLSVAISIMTDKLTL